ncbi:MAG: sigma-70 family RNA polymerase sigma factor [Planctomycetota bacterium]
MTADTPTGPDAVLRELQWVRRLARRLLADEALADDVAQDAWLAARAGLPHDDGRQGGLRRWLATVVRNRVRRLVRGDRRRVVREQAVVATREVVDAADPADVVARVALHTEVAQAVAALEEPFRSALSWHYLDELPATEVARRQGIRHDAARKRISRGLQLLRERLAYVRPGGFAAWCLDWTRVLGPAGAAAATVPLMTVILMKKWWLMSGAAAVALWFAWPDASNAQPPGGSTVAQAPLAERAALDGEVPTTAPSRIEATAAQVGVQLVDDAGRALPGVQVLALRDGALVAAARSDERGRAVFAAPLRADEWLLVRPGAVPERRARDAEAIAEQQLVLSAGHVVAGEVRGGAAPVASLRLEHDRAAAAFDGLDAAATAALDALGLTAGSVELTVGDDGRFRCVGLAADWSGAMTAPPGYTLREPSRRGVVERRGALLLRQPADDLVLEWTPPLQVRGRLLAAGAPAPGLRAWASVIEDERAAQPVVSDDDGRFVVPVRAPRDDGMWAASLLVMDEHDGALLRLPLRATPGQRELDVGDLQLDGALEVVVLGDGDTPLAGARVSVGGELPVSRVTDAAGRVRFAATPPGANRVSAHADGHRAERRELPDDRRLTIRLASTNELVVHAVAADGSLPAAALALQVAADQPFLPGARGEALKGEDGRYGLLLTLDERGQAQLSDLEPGVMVQLAVRDDLGQVVAEHTVAAPGPGQRTTVELTTSARLFAFAGVVRDQRGRPVPRARLHVEADGFAVHGRTDADGRFALGPLRRAMRDVHVEVVHPAFVAWVHDDVAIDAESAPLDVVLETGRVVEVAALQQSGAPLPDGMLLAELDGGGGLAERTAPGRYLFQGLAQRAGRVYVQLGGREFSASIGAQDTFVELRVPDLGAVAVSLADSVEQRGVRLCVAVSEVGGEVVDRDYFRVGEPAVRTLWLPAGSYRLQLEQRRMGRRGFQVLGERVVEVRAGASVELALP